MTLIKDKVIEVEQNKGIEVYACGVDRPFMHGGETRPRLDRY